jgi:xylulokinase
MKGELLLGIDLGTSSIKANAIDRHGRSIGIGTAPTPFAATADSVEMSAAALFGQLREALGQLGELRHRIVGVGISSMGETGTTIHSDGPSGLPLIAWHDKRGSEAAAALAEHFGAEEILARTGRAARSVTSVAKLGWLASHGATLAGTWTGVAGLVLWRLTGALGQEHSLAATSGAYDPVAGRYDREILTAAGLNHIAWAPARVAGTMLGRVSAQGAEWSELPSGIPVTIAGHDHPVGVVGSGGEQGEVIDSLGTGEPLVVSWQPDRTGRHPTIPGLPGDLTVTGWPGTARHMLLWETLRPGLAMSNLLSHLDMTRNDIEFAAIRVEADGLPMADLLRMQSGEVPRHVLRMPPHVAWAATLEGYASAAAHAEQGLRSLTGTRGMTLLIGGGLRSRRWIEAKMHCTAWPLAMAAEREAVSRGAALLAGVAASWWKPESYPPADVTPIAGPVSSNSSADMAARPI